MKDWKTLRLLKYIYFLPLFYLLPITFSVQAQQWQSVGNGTSHIVRTLFSDTLNNLLYIGGSFKYADSLEVRGIAVWDGQNWSKLDTTDLFCEYGNCNPIFSLKLFNNILFVSGQFGYFGSNITRLKKWDGNNWTDCGNPNAPVLLSITNNELFALGAFDTISNKPIDKIAKWNGSSWDAFGSSFKGWSVECTAYFMNEYYFGGNFEEPNNIKEIMRWDGSSWMNLQNGILGDSWVNDMVVFKGYLFVGGLFYKNDGNAADFIMTWDGQQWSNPFPQIQYMNQVRDLEIINNELYIVGNFIDPNDTGMYAFAKYNGYDFCAFGGKALFPYIPDPQKITGLNNNIYVGCNQLLFNDTVNYIAQWIGSSYDTCYIIPLSNQNFINEPKGISISPNPFTNLLTIEFNSSPLMGGQGGASFILYDVTGKEIARLEKNHLSSCTDALNASPCKHQEQIDTWHLSPGIYFLIANINRQFQTMKILKSN